MSFSGKNALHTARQDLDTTGNRTRREMLLSRSAVQELYTKRIDRYSSFIATFQSRHGMQALLRRSHLLRPGLRVLDAGCGFGTVTFAFWRHCGRGIWITRQSTHSTSHRRCWRAFGASWKPAASSEYSFSQPMSSPSKLFRHRGQITT